MRSNLLQQAVILSNFLLIKTTSSTDVERSSVSTCYLYNTYQDQSSAYYRHIPNFRACILRKGMVPNLKNQGLAKVPKNDVITFLKKHHKTNEASLETAKDKQLLDKFSDINYLFRHLLEMTFYMDESGHCDYNIFVEKNSCGFLYYLISQLPNRNIIECFYNRILNNFKKIGAESTLLEAITIDLNTVIDAMGEAAKELQDYIYGKDFRKVVDWLQIEKPSYGMYDQQPRYWWHLYTRLGKESYLNPQVPLNSLFPEWKLDDSDKAIYQEFNKTRISLENKYIERCLPALFRLLHHAFMFYNIALKENNTASAHIDVNQHLEVILDIQTMNSLSLLLFDFLNIMQARCSKLRLYDLDKRIREYFEKKLSEINGFDKTKTNGNKLSTSQRVFSIYENYNESFPKFSRTSDYYDTHNLQLYVGLVDSIAEITLAVKYDIPDKWENKLPSIV